MIKLDCNNYLIKQTLSNFLENKKLSISTEDEIYFTIIKVRETEKNIHIIIDGIKKELSIPLDLNILASAILKSIADINFSINGYLSSCK